jgi:hypothetical protein
MVAFLSRNAWAIPLAFGVVLGAVGWTSYRALEHQMMAELGDSLQTILRADVAALQIWVDENKAIAAVGADDPRVEKAAERLLAVAHSSGEPRDALLAAPAQAELRALLAPSVAAHGYTGFGLVAPSGLFLAATRDATVGGRMDGAGPMLERILAGESVVTPPLLFSAGTIQARPQILIGAPVRDETGRLIAAFGFSADPEREFRLIFSIARPGASGETYAFDADGLMLSPSRFEDQLHQIGLLAADASSFMTVQIRDPGGDLSRGYRPELPLKARPLTRMAADAVSGNGGLDVDGYRDYRGIPVAGAWTWLPDLQLGVVTEIDIAEAYHGLYVLQQRFGIVVVVLLLQAAAMFLYSFVVVRLRSKVDEARELGRYRIEKKLGSGGMGTVYLASHALLRRPTAIKVLRPEASSRESIARFEREVQITSALTHPNTIDIYDFGYTPDGTFYYAMEYLKGITLGACVEADGAQSEARVLHVMKQACASIAEAHVLGLMHRDLKPSNIMLCERGGMFDFVKVLDFGLVREQSQAKDVALTDVASLTGTPLYMPPESVQAPDTLDVRGDVYQLGAIAYYLLAGRHVFQGDSAFDVLAQHVGNEPEPPSKVIGSSLSPELERVVLWCLNKNPADRPAHAGVLLEALEECKVEGYWGQREARAWWSGFRERNPHVADSIPDTSTSSHPSGYTIDLGKRLHGREPGDGGG